MQRKPEKIGDLELLNEKGGIQGLVDILQCNISTGLQTNDVAERREYFGTNARTPPQPRGFCRIIWDAFGDTLLRILFVSGIISIIINEIFDEDKEIGIFPPINFFSMARWIWYDFCCYCSLSCDCNKRHTKRKSIC